MIKQTDRWNNKGFSLIEMSIVLVIAGILISFGVSMIGPLVNRAKTSETKEILNSAKDSLVGFAVTNHRLPRIIPVAPSTTPEYLPVLTKTNDAWGKPIQYIVDATSTDTTDAICGRTTTSLTVRICTAVGLTGNCTTYTDVPNTAFLILSDGGNFNNQTAQTQSISSSSSITVYNPGLNVDGYVGDVGGPRQEPYDDIVNWVTLPELQQKMNCQLYVLRVVTKDLTIGTRLIVYPSTTLSATGGTPRPTPSSPYSWAISTAGLPPGLSLNPDTGVISGTPSDAGTYSFEVRVTDSKSLTATQRFSITINP